MNDQMKQQIMGRVIAIYIARKYGPPAFFGAMFFAGFVAMWRLVSFSNVFTNMPSITNPSESYNFFSVALQNTETAVQLSLGVVIVAMLSYAVILVRTLQGRSGVITKLYR